MLKDIVEKGRPEPAVTGTAAAAAGSDPSEPETDPWYRDDERKAEVNEATRAGSRWLRRGRGDWLR